MTLDLGPWLARPIAHRGLHCASQAIIENTRPAFLAAVAAGYGIEADLREAGCGAPAVFHDETLERLTAETGRVRDYSLAELEAIPFRCGHDRIIGLAALLDLVNASTPLMLEIKTGGGNAARFARRIAAELGRYQGRAAVMSFDAASLKPFRGLAPHLPRGIVAMRFRARDWPEMSAWQRFAATNLLNCRIAKPHFIAYHIKDIARLPVQAARRFCKTPVFCWTVRTQTELREAANFADNIIFETMTPVWPVPHHL